MNHQASNPGIDVLNCGTGHTEFRYDGANPIELDRAKRIVSDMLRRGYVLFVEGADGALIRVEKFDAEKSVYIVSDVPSESNGSGAGASDLGSMVYQAQEQSCMSGSSPELPTEPAVSSPKRRGRPRKVELPMETTRVTAIGQSAGG